jgi:hypothetical protein
MFGLTEYVDGGAIQCQRMTSESLLRCTSNVNLQKCEGCTHKAILTNFNSNILYSSSVRAGFQKAVLA